MVHGGGKFGINQCHIPVRCRILNIVFVFFQIAFQRIDKSVVDGFAPLLTSNQAADIVA